MWSELNAVSSIAVLVVVSNEELHLSGCLKALSEFDGRVTVVDLASTDGSAKVARDFGARVVPHPPTPHVEQVLSELADLFSPDTWVLRLDPDERIPANLLRVLTRARSDAVRSGHSVVELPLRYRFAGDPLVGTPWGGVRYFPRLFRWGGVMHGGQLHEDIRSQVTGGVARVTGVDPIEHYWVEGWSDFAKKNARYLRLEGASRYDAGERFGLVSAVAHGIRAVRRALASVRLGDGMRGLGLSAGYVAYVVGADISLARYSRRQGRGSDGNQGASS